MSPPTDVTALPAHMVTPKLQAVMQLTVHVAKPIEAGEITHALGTGKRRIIPIIGGQVQGVARGHSMAGEVLAGGADFQLVTSATSAQLDARYVIRLNDGSHIYVANSAVRTGSEQDIAALIRGESVPPERIYFRCAPRFEVARADLAWMTQTLFIGTGARFPDRVEMVFYEVK